METREGLFGSEWRRQSQRGGKGQKTGTERKVKVKFHQPQNLT